MKRIVPFFFMLLLSCTLGTKPNNQVDVTVIDMGKLKEGNPFVINEKLDSCRFVKLETSANCIVGWPAKIIVKEDLIFIKDNKEKLFVFDINGKYLNTIGQIGKGPDELLSLGDFYVNEQKHYVAIWDALRSQIIRYSYKGDILNKMKCDLKYVNKFSDMRLVDDDKIALTLYHGPDLGFNYRIIDQDKYTFDRNSLPVHTKIVKETSYNNAPTISGNGRNSYAISLFSDTIYKFKSDNFYPQFVLKSKLKPANYEIINKNSSYNSVSEVSSFLSRYNYSPGISSLFSTNDYLYFNYIIGNNYYEVLWNIPLGRGFYRLNYISYNIFRSTRYLMTTTSDAFVCLIPPMDAIEGQKGKYAIKDPRIEKVMYKLNCEDNPILGFYFIKKQYAKNHL